MKREMSLTLGVLMAVVAVMQGGCQSGSKAESMALTGSAQHDEDHSDGLTSHRTPKGGRAYDRS